MAPAAAVQAAEEGIPLASRLQMSYQIDAAPGRIAHADAIKE
jgi:hypothetical protein